MIHLLHLHQSLLHLHPLNPLLLLFPISLTSTSVLLQYCPLPTLLPPLHLPPTNPNQLKRTSCPSSPLLPLLPSNLNNPIWQVVSSTLHKVTPKLQAPTRLGKVVSPPLRRLRSSRTGLSWAYQWVMNGVDCKWTRTPGALLSTPKLRRRPNPLRCTLSHNSNKA